MEKFSRRAEKYRCNLAGELCYGKYTVRETNYRCEKHWNWSNASIGLHRRRWQGGVRPAADASTFATADSCGMTPCAESIRDLPALRDLPYFLRSERLLADPFWCGFCLDQLTSAEQRALER